MQNTNIVTDEENVAGVGAPVALVGREAGRWLQAGGGGGGACVEPSCSWPCALPGGTRGHQGHTRQGGAPHF